MRHNEGIRSAARLAAFGLSFLFFVQSAAVLVQSVYILDLMNLELDLRAAGLLFFFSPLLLPLLRGRAAKFATWASLALLLLARMGLPWLGTEGRLLGSGLAVAAALLFLPLSWTGLSTGRVGRLGATASQGFALSIALSILFRALGRGLDASLEASGGWIGLILGLALLAAFSFTQRGEGEEPAEEPAPGAATPGANGAATLGAGGAATDADLGAGQLSLLLLSWFAFSSPGVIARWTGLPEPPISIATSLLALLWIRAAELAPDFALRLNRRILGAWNAAFVACLGALLLLNTPAFPAEPGLVLEVGGPGALQIYLLALLLLLYPVIFVDFARLSAARAGEGDRRKGGAGSRRGPSGLLLGSAWICLLVFANIFSNVWAYVPPVSSPFRGQYWLSFTLAAALPGLLALLRGSQSAGPGSGAEPLIAGKGPRLAGLLGLALLFGATLVAELPRRSPSPPPIGRKVLRVMTYNIQQGVNGEAERAWAKQLELIRRINPDLLALQESDSARISLGNDDMVRRFAGELGYYSFYGPSVAAGTFGTALLSRYPLEDPRVFYSYSDEDEVGTTQARLRAPDGDWTVFCVHPAGSAAVDEAFATALLERVAGKPRALALGDFNLRRGEPAYERIAASMVEAWSSLHPGTDPLDPERAWIDHILVSSGITIRDGTYILPPDSHTDHPAHWADLAP